MDIAPDDTEAAEESLSNGSGMTPFDARFFQTVFPERIRAACLGTTDAVPVVLLQLADGRTLDLCHIETLTPAWMAVQAFRDKGSCEEMDVVFVPYQLITLVTLSPRTPTQRRVGFRLEVPSSSTVSGRDSQPRKEHRCQSLDRT